MLDACDVEVESYVDLSAALPRMPGGWRDADRELRRLAARRCALDSVEARWLRAARDAQVHLHLGFGSFVEYVERTLGYRPRTVLERLRVADALATLPTLDDALARGLVSYSTVRELTRVATVPTEHAWLDAVAGKAAREVAAMVAGRALGDHPATPPQPGLRTRHLRLELSPDVYARFLAARRQLEEQCGERLSDDDVIASLCDAALAPSDARGPRSQIAVTVCAHCDRAWQDAAGQTVEVAPDAVELARCDAHDLGRVDGDAPAPVTVDIPAAVRRQVERRDRSRCVVPGCRCSRYLHMHHLVPRASGGDHVARNLCLLCTAHHRAVHDGRLRIRGHAPALSFEHDDGRQYGAPPPGTVDGGSGAAGRGSGAVDCGSGAVDHGPETQLALCALGFTLADAATAVRRARAHVDVGASLEDWIREALLACRRAGA